MKELLTLNKYLYRYRYRFLLGIAFILGLNLFTVYKIRFVGKAVNFIKDSLTNTENADINTLIFYGSLIIILPIIAGALQFLMRQTIIVASRYIEYDLKNVVYKHYQTLDTSFYKNHRIGDLMNRISEDVGYIRMYLGPGIMYPLNLIIMSSILIVEMLSVDTTMTFYTLMPLPFLSCLVYVLSSKIHRKSTEVQAKQSDLSSFVQDHISGIRVIKAFNKSTTVKQNYAKKARVYRDTAISLANIDAFFSPLIVIVIGLSQIIILYIGGMRYINGKIPEIGTLAQFFMYLNMLIWPFTSLGWVSMVIQRAEASMKRINEFIGTRPLIQNSTEEKFNIKGNIKFENVSYVYENTGIRALKNISFEIKEKDTLAILGKTGSGKTTIVELIMRLYDTSQGNIYIDGINIKQYNVYNLRNQIGIVPQEAFLFSDTIQENIAFGNDVKDMQQIQHFAKKADVHENIIHFKNGYNTKIGERGVTLSGGQKQRVSIARALYKKPEILIFDDSLSAVDTETEEKILTNIRKETEGKTTIIVTHRISSAKNADKIIVLDEGKIIEQGTHEELMQQNSNYRQIYLQQAEKV